MNFAPMRRLRSRSHSRSPPVRRLKRATSPNRRRTGSYAEAYSCCSPSREVTHSRSRGRGSSRSVSLQHSLDPPAVHSPIAVEPEPELPETPKPVGGWKVLKKATLKRFKNIKDRITPGEAESGPSTSNHDRSRVDEQPGIVDRRRDRNVLTRKGRRRAGMGIVIHSASRHSRSRSPFSSIVHAYITNRRHCAKTS